MTDLLTLSFREEPRGTTVVRAVGEIDISNLQHARPGAHLA